MPGRHVAQSRGLGVSLKQRRGLGGAVGILALTSFRHPRSVLLGVLLLTAVLSSGLPRLSIDTSTQGLLKPDDQVILDYVDFREIFGRDDLIVIGLRPRAVFEPSFLAWLKELHLRLNQEVPQAARVTSLINVRRALAGSERLYLDRFLSPAATREFTLAELRDQALANPIFRNLLLSEDGRTTAVLLELETPLWAPASGGPSQAGPRQGMAQDLEGFVPSPLSSRPGFEAGGGDAVRKIRTLVAESPLAGLEVFLAGQPVIREALKKLTLRDIKVYLGLCLLIMALILGAFFRTWAGVALPLGVVSLSLAATFGVMGLLGVQIKHPTTILPVFLLAVGVADSVHLLALFHQGLRAGRLKEEALVSAVERAGPALVLTSLTTAAGLLSFVLAEIAPVADLGLFSALGVGLALFLSLTFLPALIALLPLPVRFRKTAQTLSPERPGPSDRFLTRLASLSSDRPGTVLAWALALIVLALAGTWGLRFSHDPLAWLSPDLPARQSTEKLDQELKGTVLFEVLIDSREENGLQDPGFLSRLDLLAQSLRGRDLGSGQVAKVLCLTDPLREIHLALHEGRPGAHALPQSRNLAAQELLLLESGGLQAGGLLMDPQNRRTRLSIKLPWMDTLLYLPFMTQVRELARGIMGPEPGLILTGEMAVLSRTLDAAIRSAAKSYVLALSSITVLMVVMIGGLKLGLLSLIPNLAPLLAVLGFMSWLGLPLDMSTMLVFSVAIGLAVDDTIHFFHHYKLNLEITDRSQMAVQETIRTVGPAMLTTSLALALGFAVFVLASLENIRLFGLLTALAVILALLADLVLTPALLTRFGPSRFGPKRFGPSRLGPGRSKGQR